jgi:hypothetical protein
MTDTAYSPAPDEPIVYVSHHRELIRRAGRLAKAEQEQLERQLRDSRTPGPD